MVEDSAFMRKVLLDMINEIPGLEVVGIARDGVYLKNAIKEYNPDIITLDIEMPKMNGLEALKEIRKCSDIPVIMLSSISNQEATIEALNIGAEDFIEKPKNISRNLDEFRDELEKKIKSVSKNRDNINSTYTTEKSMKEVQIQDNIESIVIAASTGGPKALTYIITRMPKTTKPIFVVQHMPKNFTESFARRLDDESELTVVEAEDGMTIKGGNVYIAPGGYHMFLEENRIVLDDSLPKRLGVRPSADYLFSSASKIYKDRLIGVILTGMGRDGTEGARDIQRMGGYNIAQDEESSVIFGMAESAITSGSINEILSLKDISKKINKILG